MTNTSDHASILIIDDNKENLFALKKVLHGISANVVAVDSANKALIECKHTEFACILADVQMPNVDGFEFAQRLREDGAFMQGPILFISAMYHEMSSIHKGYECGAVDYILKPFDPVILLSKVKIFLELFNERKKVETLLEKQKEMTETLEQFVYKDSLTGLGNRRQFNDVIYKRKNISMRHKEPFVLLIIDVDFFKHINDTFGHDIGDLLLIEMSQKLSKLVRKSDTIARVGGDEFAVIMPKVKDITDASVLADKILDELSNTYYLNDKEINASVSVGISLFSVEDSSIRGLFKKADIALYRAKEKGRNNAQFHSVTISEQHNARMQIQLQLPQAIKLKEFSMVYQPYVDIKTGAIVGAEALIRWNSHLLGNVSPEFFIPIAEASGVIKEISAWVLEETCQEYRQWQKKHQMTDFKLSINVSPIDLLSLGFLENLMNVIRFYDIAPSSLTLELTESHFDDKKTALVAILNELSQKEFNIAIDDFGTGASSLSRLIALPASIIKMDKSFIQNIGHSKAAEDVIELTLILAKKLNLQVVVEGIETAEQLAFMQKASETFDAGAIIYQGYYYSKPITPKNFRLLLKKNGLK